MNITCLYIGDFSIRHRFKVKGRDILVEVYQDDLFLGVPYGLCCQLQGVNEDDEDDLPFKYHERCWNTEYKINSTTHMSKHTIHVRSKIQVCIG